jgi:protein TonB
MYRSDLGTKDRSGAIAAVIAIHAALLVAFLNISGRMPLPASESVLQVLDIKSPDPLPPPQEKQQPRQKRKEGGAAPPNIKSEATPLAAPKPRIVVPSTPQIAAAETPRQGAASTQGAANLPGPGTGAGGAGTGAGAGAGGSGTGEGGEGAAYPPHLATPVLRGRDFPRGLLDQWPSGAPVFLRLRVDPRGYVSECVIDRRTGVAAIDGEICNLAYQRLRFRPALNRYGQPVAGWFGYAQPPPR